MLKLLYLGQYQVSTDIIKHDCKWQAIPNMHKLNLNDETNYGFTPAFA